jgi:hypothetical protein
MELVLIAFAEQAFRTHRSVAEVPGVPREL